MGEFNDMANGAAREQLQQLQQPFTVSKRRGPATVFATQGRRRTYPNATTGIPLADPEKSGALYIDSSRFLKVSEG